jgi:hypothetical protein
LDSFPVAGWRHVQRESTESEPWAIVVPFHVPTRSAAVTAGIAGGATAAAAEESDTRASFFAHATKDRTAMNRKVVRIEPLLKVPNVDHGNMLSRLI